jgi:ferrochelatase
LSNSELKNNTTKKKNFFAMVSLATMKEIKMKKTGVLLINLGTPHAPSRSAIRRYLCEFLLDPRVIDIPFFLRLLLVYLFILPFRPRRILAAYQKIYTAKGSPLLVHSENVRAAVQKILGSSYQVRLAMRYGAPSIAEEVAGFEACARVVIVPLYPHYAASSTATALARVYQEMARPWNVKDLSTVPAFYQHPGFISCWRAQIARSAQQHQGWDFLLFSFHGLPQRHLSKSGCARATTSCSNDPCPIEEVNNAAFCYRWQCYKTAQLIAASLGLAPSAYGVSFQSRLGRTPWIQPFTDQEFEKLYQRGIRKLAVVSPSFVSDCLETLEEIGIRFREDWERNPGAELIRIDCLNDEPQWCEELAKMII